MHALIIDDDKNSLYVLSQILSMEGITSTIVSDPSTLDQILKDATPIRIVFLDLEMPEKNGYQVFEKLKADPRFANVPIVACSVHIGQMSTTRSRGFDGFIGKPINADRFSEELRLILSGQSVWTK
jgi:two-component system cell cycle response regulator DivK